MRLLKGFTDFFRDGKGALSMMRLLSFVATLTGVALILISMLHPRLEVAVRERGIVTGAMLIGAALGGKGWQKVTEAKNGG